MESTPTTAVCTLCGGSQNGHAANHRELRRNRRLRRRLTAVCALLDEQRGTRPGAAERAVYFWYWPPSDSTGVDVLENLLADAVSMITALPDDDWAA